MATPPWGGILLTGISHVNLVLQQSGNVQEAHAARHPTAEQGQMAAAQQQAAKAEALKGKVPEAEKSDTMRTDKDAGQRNPDHRRGKEKEKKETAAKQAEDTGRLLDTVA